MATKTALQYYNALVYNIRHADWTAADHRSAEKELSWLTFVPSRDCWVYIGFDARCANSDSPGSFFNVHNVQLFALQSLASCDALRCS
jgi:hypothetical protein